ncbi:MAG TPA: SIMPL domain-containing protein, partial [Caulobacteraceae bacterium]
MKSTVAIALAMGLACSPGFLRAEVPTGGFAATTLDLTASGEVKAPPDMATINLGVSNTARSASEAIRANATRM